MPEETPQPMIARALDWAQRGFHTFLVRPGAKAPPIKGWRDLATTDEHRLRNMWEDEPDANGAWHPGKSGHLILDVDVKKGKNGLAALAALESELGETITDTLTIRTPSGGLQLVFKVDQLFPNSTGADGLDIKCDRGYGMIPGSILVGHGDDTPGTYAILKDLPVKRAGPKLLAWFRTRGADHSAKSAGRTRGADHSAKSTGRDVPSAEEDLPWNVDRAARWLSTYPQAIEGRGGDDHTLKAAYVLRDLGCSRKKTFELMAEWNTLNLPPWSTDPNTHDRNSLYVKVRNAYDFPQNEEAGVRAISKADDAAFKTGVAKWLDTDEAKAFLSQPNAPAKWVADLNNNYAVVKHGTKALIADFTEVERGGLISFMEFEAFRKLYSNRWAPKQNPSDENETRQRLGTAWTNSSERRQYLGGVVFDPGNMNPPPGVLNLWLGFGTKPAMGDWSLMQAHLRDVICAGNEERYHWLLGWLACGLQHLDQPLGIALALRGEQGAGKGMMAHWYGRLFAPHYLHLSSPGELTGRFNARLGTSVCVFLDEALFAGNREHEGILKALVTEPTLQAEGKFKDPITVQNRLRLIIASNNDWIVPVGLGDRRFAVFDVASIRVRDFAYFDALGEQMKRGGLAAMFHDLFYMDLSSFEVRNIPGTAARVDQMTQSLPSLLKWLHTALHEGTFGVETTDWEQHEIEISRDEAYNDYERFSKAQHEYRPMDRAAWSKKVREALRHCVEDAPRPRGEGRRPRRLRFKPLSECRAAFAAHVKTTIEWDTQERDGRNDDLSIAAE